MTKQNRKALLICIAVVIGSFVIRNVVISTIPVSAMRRRDGCPAEEDASAIPRSKP